MAIPKHMTFTLTDDRFVGINEIQRSAIGNEIVTKIQERTARGIDKDGNAFAPYESSYVNSRHFKDAGKTNDVNLSFSDEMMNSLVYLPELSDGNKITVGFINGSEENRIAQYVIEGHGRKGDFTQAKRNPLGLTIQENEEVKNMVSEGGSNIVFLGLAAGFLEGIF